MTGIIRMFVRETDFRLTITPGRGTGIMVLIEVSMEERV